MYSRVSKKDRSTKKLKATATQCWLLQTEQLSRAKELKMYFDLMSLEKISRSY